MHLLVIFKFLLYSEAAQIARCCKKMSKAFNDEIYWKSLWQSCVAQRTSKKLSIPTFPQKTSFKAMVKRVLPVINANVAGRYKNEISIPARSLKEKSLGVKNIFNVKKTSSVTLMERSVCLTYDIRILFPSGKVKIFARSASDRSKYYGEFETYYNDIVDLIEERGDNVEEDLRFSKIGITYSRMNYKRLLGYLDEMVLDAVDEQNFLRSCETKKLLIFLENKKDPELKA